MFRPLPEILRSSFLPPRFIEVIFFAVTLKQNSVCLHVRVARTKDQTLFVCGVMIFVFDSYLRGRLGIEY